MICRMATFNLIARAVIFGISMNFHGADAAFSIKASTSDSRISQWDITLISNDLDCTRSASVCRDESLQKLCGPQKITCCRSATRTCGCSMKKADSKCESYQPLLISGQSLPLSSDASTNVIGFGAGFKVFPGKEQTERVSMQMVPKYDFANFSISARVPLVAHKLDNGTLLLDIQLEGRQPLSNFDKLVPTLISRLSANQLVKLLDKRVIRELIRISKDGTECGDSDDCLSTDD